MPNQGVITLYPVAPPASQTDTSGRITLWSPEATPSNVVLRGVPASLTGASDVVLTLQSLPQADVTPPVVMWLYGSNLPVVPASPNPSDIILQTVPLASTSTMPGIITLRSGDATPQNIVMQSVPNWTAPTPQVLTLFGVVAAGVAPPIIVTLHSTQFLESSAPGVTYYGVLKRWSGAWAKAKLKRWTGTAWAAATMKRWTGTAWVIVDTTG